MGYDRHAVVGQSQDRAGEVRAPAVVERVLLAGAAIAALVGQYQLTHHRATWQLAAGLWIGALVAFLWLVIESPREDRPDPPVWHIEPEGWQRWRTLLVAAGLACSALAGRLAVQRPNTEGFADLVALWLVGVALVVIAFLPGRGQWRAPGPPGGGETAPGWDAAVALAIVGAAFALRFWDLGGIPRNLGGDEGTCALDGLALLDGRLGNPFATGWFGFPNLSFIPFGLAAKVLGNTIFAVRLPTVILGTAAVLGTYLLGRELWGRWVGLVSASLLAVGHFHLHYSRLAVNNIFDTTVASLAFWLMARGFRTRSTGLMASAGLLLGLGWYGYLGARLAGVIAVAWVGWRAMVERGFLRVHWRRILIVGVAALVVMMPLVLFYLDNPAQLTSRTNQVGIFSSGWLENEVEITGLSAARIFADQVRKSVLGFNYTLDRVFWYMPQIPLLDWVSAALLLFGLVWSAARWRDPGSILLLLWFWSAVFFGWILTENPPSSMRMIIVAPVLALLVAFGLESWSELARSIFGCGRRCRAAATVAVGAVIAILNLHFYFAVYTPKRIYGNPNAELATDLAGYLVEHDDVRPLYMVGAPWLYWEFGTTRFLAPRVRGIDVPPPGESEDFEFDVTHGARFVVIPERIDELETIQQANPGGSIRRFVSEVDGRTMCTLYEIGPPAS